jgi:hypothetical protein
MPIFALNVFVVLTLFLVLQSFTRFLGGRPFQKLDHVHMTPMTSLYYVTWSFIPIVASCSLFLIYQFGCEWVGRKRWLFPQWSRYCFPLLLLLHLTWLCLYQWHKFIAAEVIALITLLFTLGLAFGTIRYGLDLKVRLAAWPWDWQDKAVDELRRNKPQSRHSRLTRYYSSWRQGHGVDERGTTRVSPEMSRLLDLQALRQDKYAGYHFIHWRDSLIFLPFSVLLAHFLYVSVNNLFVILHEHRSDVSYQDLHAGAMAAMILITLLSTLILVVCQDVVFGAVMTWILAAIAKRQYLNEEHDQHERVVMTAIVCSALLGFFVLLTLVNMLVQWILCRPRALWKKGRYLIEEEEPIQPAQRPLFYQSFDSSGGATTTAGTPTPGGLVEEGLDPRELDRERRRQFRYAGTDIEKEQLLAQRAAERDLAGVRTGTSGQAWGPGGGTSSGY